MPTQPQFRRNSHAAPQLAALAANVLLRTKRTQEGACSAAGHKTETPKLPNEPRTQPSTAAKKTAGNQTNPATRNLQPDPTGKITERTQQPLTLVTPQSRPAKRTQELKRSPTALGPQAKIPNEPKPTNPAPASGAFPSGYDISFTSDIGCPAKLNLEADHFNPAPITTCSGEEHQFTALVTDSSNADFTLSTAVNIHSVN